MLKEGGTFEITRLFWFQRVAEGENTLINFFHCAIDRYTQVFANSTGQGVKMDNFSMRKYGIFGADSSGISLFLTLFILLWSLRCNGMVATPGNGLWHERIGFWLTPLSNPY